MSLSYLQPAKGSIKKNKKRVGRGQSSGKGGTSGRGHKGAKSRSGYSRKLGFEGGQMPLQRRVPKFGFKNPNRKVYQAVNLDTIQLWYDAGKFDGVLDLETIYSFGICKKGELIKILGRGKITASLKIQAHKFSASAKSAIEEAGGEVILF